MAWLESLAAKHGAKAEELVTDPNARTDIAPDWVDKAKIISEPSAAAPAPAIEESPLASDDQTGMWLRHLEDSEAETFVAKRGKTRTFICGGTTRLDERTFRSRCFFANN